MIEEMHSCIDAKASCQFHDVMSTLYSSRQVFGSGRGPDNCLPFAAALFNLFAGLSAIGGHFNLYIAGSKLSVPTTLSLKLKIMLRLGLG
jgi:hypothetical protein